MDTKTTIAMFTIVTIGFLMEIFFLKSDLKKERRKKEYYITGADLCALKLKKIAKKSKESNEITEAFNCLLNFAPKEDKQSLRDAFYKD